MPSHFSTEQSVSSRLFRRRSTHTPVRHARFAGSEPLRLRTGTVSDTSKMQVSATRMRWRHSSRGKAEEGDLGKPVQAVTAVWTKASRPRQARTRQCRQGSLGERAVSQPCFSHHRPQRRPRPDARGLVPCYPQPKPSSGCTGHSSRSAPCQSSWHRGLRRRVAGTSSRRRWSGSRSAMPWYAAGGGPRTGAVDPAP